MVFLSSFLQYLIVMIILAVLAFVGFKCGIVLRKRKDAKEALLSDNNGESSDSTDSQETSED